MELRRLTLDLCGPLERLKLRPAGIRYKAGEKIKHLHKNPKLLGITFTDGTPPVQLRIHWELEKQNH